MSAYGFSLCYTQFLGGTGNLRLNSSFVSLSNMILSSKLRTLDLFFSFFSYRVHPIFYFSNVHVPLRHVCHCLLEIKHFLCYHNLRFFTGCCYSVIICTLYSFGVPTAAVGDVSWSTENMGFFIYFNFHIDKMLDRFRPYPLPLVQNVLERCLVLHSLSTSFNNCTAMTRSLLLRL